MIEITETDIQNANFQICSSTQVNESASVCNENHLKGKNNLLFSGKYFNLISCEDNITRAKCTTCNKTLRASKNITSNFITHLKVKYH